MYIRLGNCSKTLRASSKISGTENSHGFGRVIQTLRSYQINLLQLQASSLGFMAPLSTPSSVLWATASKEWVIQPKPKPGRKPKTDLTVKADSESQDEKGRRVQNRAAQRAFRERKQAQLAELQARILTYEQGEIDRNVALQNIAKRLKEENERLQHENQALREKLARVEQAEFFRSGNDNDRKRGRDGSSLTVGSSSVLHSRKKSRKISDTSLENLGVSSEARNSVSSSLVSSPDASEVPDDRISPLAYVLQSESSPTPVNNILSYSSGAKLMDMEHLDDFSRFNCGFCNETTPCVCREIAHHIGDGELIKAEGFPEEQLSAQSSRSASHPSPQVSSILENLPAYQPAVPLRRRSSGNSAKSPIFPIHSQLQRAAEPTCSGDPSNCMACTDDDFGKAFCSAVEVTMSGTACDNCSSRPLQGAPSDFSFSASSMSCCGNPLGCEGCIVPTPRSSVGSDSSPLEKTLEYIPTNDAWRQLKAHPNVEFADLALLAEVVASRSKCTGPRVVISPSPPDRFVPERTPFSQVGGAQTSTDQALSQRGTQTVFLECGRKRVREVRKEAVQDALRLLDAKFTI